MKLTSGVPRSKVRKAPVPRLHIPLCELEAHRRRDTKSLSQRDVVVHHIWVYTSTEVEVAVCARIMTEIEQLLHRLEIAMDQRQ